MSSSSSPRCVPFENIYAETVLCQTPEEHLPVFDQELRIDRPYLKATERLIKLNGIHVVYRDWTLPNSLILETRHEQPFLKMQFELEGHSDFRSSICRSLDQVFIGNGRHMLMFMPVVSGHLHYMRARKVLDISFSIDYIKQLFENDLSVLKHFGYGIEHEEPVLMARESREISPAMRQVIRQILHCPYQGIFKKTYLEAKVIELLNLQIDCFMQNNHLNAPLNIRKEDVEKFQYIKELITSRPEDDYSLAQLAELAGLNDFKLKKGFKQLFGQTVFGYLANVRMEKAKESLLCGGSSIMDVAYQSGYKYPQHFTKAFKKKFGYLPSELK